MHLLDQIRLFRSRHQRAADAGAGREIKTGSQWKYFFRWRQSLAGEGPLAERIPWMSFGAIDYFETILQPDFEIFEWGTGGSTLFYRSRVRKVISLEHSSDYFLSTAEPFRETVKGHSHLLIPPESATSERPPCASLREPGKDFSAYVNYIHSFPNCSFDLVSVDGRSRVNCVAAARDKVKPGGYLVLDDSERPDYAPAFSLLSDWKRISFSGCGPYSHSFWETTFFRKP